MPNVLTHNVQDSHFSDYDMYTQLMTTLVQELNENNPDAFPTINNYMIDSSINDSSINDSYSSIDSIQSLDDDDLYDSMPSLDDDDLYYDSLPSHNILSQFLDGSGYHDVVLSNPPTVHSKQNALLP